MKTMHHLRLILVITLVCALLAACSPAANTTAAPKITTTAGTTAVGQTTTATANKKPYPLVDKKVTYSMILASSTLSDPNAEVPFFKTLEDLTNVHFDFEIISSADVETKKAVIWASDDLPDFFSGGFTANSDILTYGPQGGFLVLNDYMTAKYMPNFMAVAAKQPTIIGSITTSDGKIYGFPYLGAPNMTSTAAVTINKAWLDKLGLSLPKSLAEYVADLQAFADKDPNGNGKKDEIGLSYNYASTWTYNGALSAWFGVGTTSDALIVKDKVSYSPVEDDWKVYVKFLNGLWKKGLMDIELFTQSSDTFNAKGKQALYGSTVCYDSTYYSTEEYAKNYVFIGPFNGGASRFGAYRDRPDGAYAVLARGAISAKCKNPEILVRWVDTLYDDYYCAQSIYGVIGIHVDLDQDKAMVARETPSKYTSATEWKNYTTFNQIPGYLGTTYASKILGKDTARIFQTKAITEYAKQYLNQIMPYNYQSKAENDVMKPLITDLSKYANQMFAAWVSGERDIDADWSNYLTQMKALGSDKYVTAYQAYYDRIMKLMK